jgi:high-affinity K+ transport system ATPase subunit B
VFLVVTVTLLPFSIFSVAAAGASKPVTITVLVALLVCLIPTTIGGLLSAIGVAGMSRMMRANVIAASGRAVEAAGDVDVLLLDKTGTMTLGNAFPDLFRGHQAVGSRLIGQAFSSPADFWGRPSATTPMPNNAASSSGSNLGPLNPAYQGPRRCAESRGPSQ